MDYVDLRFNAGVEYNGKIYASAIHVNGLFQLDLYTHEVIRICKFTEEESCYAIHRKAFLYEHEAWFVPQNGKYIAVVNLDSFEIEYLNPIFNKINKCAVSRTNAMYYSGEIIEDRYLYLVPANVDTLLLIDLKTKELYPYYNVQEGDEYFLYGIYIEGYVYLFPINKNRIIEINLRTDERKQYTWKDSAFVYKQVIYFNEKLWFSPFDSKNILIFDLVKKGLESIPLGEFYNPKFTYDEIAVEEDNIFFIPFQADKILKYNINKGEFSEIYLERKLLENGVNGFTRIYSKDRTILTSYSNSVILIYDKYCETFQKIKIRIKKNMLEFDEFLRGDIYEEKLMGMNYYVLNIPLKQNVENNKNATVGEKILGVISNVKKN